MRTSGYGRYLLPVLLGVLGILLLLRVLFASGSLLPNDLDVVSMVAVLAAILVIAIQAIVRVAMSYWRQQSTHQARRETLAEHGRFLRRLDHELKNPLTALRAGLKTLALTELSQQQQQLVATLETETLRLNRLVTDLRKLTELEAQPLNRQMVDMERFVTHLMQLERERFDSGERSFHSEVNLAQPAWWVDEDLLTLAIHNLLDNAYKYTRPGDAVQLQVTIHSELTIEVADTGPGISAEAIPQIWEELYRAEQVEKVPGSGIGLSLVKAIVERHQGRVEIQSDDRGTAVRLHLPAIQPI